MGRRRGQSAKVVKENSLPESVGPEIDALNLLVDKERQKWFSKQDPPISVIRDYAKGKVQLNLTSEQMDMLEGILGNQFCHNICERILSDCSDRLEFLGYDCKSETEAQWLSEWFTLNQLDLVSNDVHFQMLRDRNVCVALQWDAKRNMPVIYIESWWDGCEGMFVSYDGQRNVKYAASEWIEDPNSDEAIKRRNIWMKGKLYRYRGTPGSWEPFQLEEDPSWPVVFTNANNEPGNIPIVHFANQATDQDHYGDSELDGGVLGFQDQINDVHWDESSAGRSTGFQMLWGTGVEFDDDPENPEQKLQPAVGPGQFITSDKPEARFGTFPPGDITQLIALKSDKLKDVSHMTATPFHVISGGDWPTGEALYRAEMPAVNKANSKIKRLKPKWVEVAHRAMEMFNRNSKPVPTATIEPVKLNEDVKTALVTARFAPADRRDPLSRAVVVQTLGAHISTEEALRIMGYTEADIERIVGEKKAELDDMQARMEASFNAGTAPGSGIGGGAPNPKTPKAVTPKAGKPTSPTSSNTKRT